MVRAKIKTKNKTNTPVNPIKKRQKRFLIKRLLFAGKILIILGFIAVSSLIYTNANSIMNDWYQVLAKMGFVLQEITVTGAKYSNNDQIGKTLKLKHGMPIFSISLSDLKSRLEKIEWIRYAIVERELPNSIHISIVERTPIALGQKGKKLTLIDDEGSIINKFELKEHIHLPIIIGDGAEIYANSLIKMLETNPELFKRVNAVIMVSERRWNVRFDNDLEIKLPEEKMAEAWNKVIKLYQKNELFLPDIAVIDLRVENKIFVEKK